MAEESRAPISIPTYKLGDEGKPNHFAASTSRENAAEEAKSLAVGDAAFIKRSDLKWTYAIVTEKVEGDSTILRFEVDKDRNRKSFPQAQWGKYIRVIKIDEEEMAKLKEEAEPKKEEEEKPAEEEEKKSAEEAPKEEEAKPEEAPKEEEAKPAEEAAKEEETKPAEAEAEAKKEEKVESSEKSTGGDTSASKGSKSGSWFSGFGGGIFGSSSKKEEKKANKSEEKAAEAPKADEASKADATAAEESTAVATEDGPAAPPAPVDTAAEASAAEGGSVETPIEGHAIAAEPMTEDPAAAALAATSFPKDNDAKEEAVAPLVPSVNGDAAPESAPEPDNTKENSDPKEFSAAPVFLPSPKSGDDASKAQASAPATPTTPASTSSLRNPLNLKPTLSLKKKNSLLNKVFKKTPPKTSEKKVLVQSPKTTAANTTAALGGAVPKSPKGAKGAEQKKEWFDPEACEVDYDKNPTDLFQALEARQFSYADEMFKQVNRQFTKECRTWVVARGQKKKDSSQLRFRALPLHAALVFGAPDDMIKKILNSYPKATRGRDVKGRLPIHLAMEHNASEEIVCLILEAFPKGFYARDKKDMVPLDYVNGNMSRCHMKRYIPLITQAKVEEERARWEEETEEALEAQKVALKGDAEYMRDVVATVTDDVEMAYATKMELLETNYQKEILLLKKKHDSETQALLEGFEVKLNFERKLQKLKGKA